MTVQEILDMAFLGSGSLLALDLDAYQGEAPTATQQRAAYNRAQLLIGKRIRPFDTKITLTLTLNIDTYSLRDTTAFGGREVLELHHVIINGSPLLRCDRSGPGLWSFREFQDYRRTWFASDADIPTAACVINQSLLLNPKPSAACISGGSNFASGVYLPADIGSGALGVAPPDMPRELHPALALLAAYQSAYPSATESEQWQRLKTMMGDAYDAIEELRNENVRSQDDWGSTHNTGPDLLWT